MVAQFVVFLLAVAITGAGLLAAGLAADARRERRLSDYAAEMCEVADCTLSSNKYRCFVTCGGAVTDSTTFEEVPGDQELCWRRDEHVLSDYAYHKRRNHTNQVTVAGAFLVAIFGFFLLMVWAAHDCNVVWPN